MILGELSADGSDDEYHDFVLKNIQYEVLDKIWL